MVGVSEATIVDFFVRDILKSINWVSIGSGNACVD